MNDNNMYYKLLKYITLIFLISPICFMILDIEDITQYIHLSKNYDWLSFYGTIIVGYTAIIRVLLTLSQEKEIEKERVHPCIKITSVNSNKKSSSSIFLYSNKCSKKSNTICIKLKIENIGNNELKNLYMKSIFMGSIFDFYQDIKDKGFIISNISEKDSIILSIYIKIPSKRKNSKYNFGIIARSFDFEFVNCYGNNYIQKFFFGIRYDFNNDYPTVTEIDINPVSPSYEVTDKKIEEIELLCKYKKDDSFKYPKNL